MLAVIGTDVLAVLLCGDGMAKALSAVSISDCVKNGVVGSHHYVRSWKKTVREREPQSLCTQLQRRAGCIEQLNVRCVGIDTYVMHRPACPYRHVRMHVYRHPYRHAYRHTYRHPHRHVYMDV